MSRGLTGQQLGDLPITSITTANRNRGGNQPQSSRIYIVFAFAVLKIDTKWTVVGHFWSLLSVTNKVI